MSKGKNAPEMFEAFHRMGRAGQQPEPVKKAVEPRREPAASSATPVRGVVKPVSTGGMLTPGVTPHSHIFPLGKRADVVFPFSYNALVVTAVVLVLAAMLVFFIGYRLGQNATTVAQTPVEPEGSQAGLNVYDGKGDQDTEGNNAGTQGGNASSRKYYLVQVATYHNRASSRVLMENAREFLKSQGIPDIKSLRSESGRDIWLLAGYYDKQEDAERLAARIRGLVYQNKKQFTTARVMSVPAKTN